MVKQCIKNIPSDKFIITANSPLTGIEEVRLSVSPKANETNNNSTDSNNTSSSINLASKPTGNPLVLLVLLSIS